MTETLWLWFRLGFWLCALWFWLCYGHTISTWLVRRFLMKHIERFACWRFGIDYRDYVEWKRNEEPNHD